MGDPQRSSSVMRKNVQRLSNGVQHAPPSRVEPSGGQRPLNRNGSPLPARTRVAGEDIVSTSRESLERGPSDRVQSNALS